METVFNIEIDEKLVWNLLPDEKTVGGILCQKASVDYGGRKWIAWFDSKNEIPEGPYVFNGLPGIIVEIYDKERDFHFSLHKINKSKAEKLHFIKKGVDIDWEKYQKIREDYYEEPFSQLKLSSAKVTFTTSSGDKVENPIDTLTKERRQMIFNNNNPIELNNKVDYK